MRPEERVFLELLKCANGSDEVRAACRIVDGPDGSTAVLSAECRDDVPEALYQCISRLSDHPSFARWARVYFGRERGSFRSELQQPTYLYYPDLPPAPWMETSVHPGLKSLVGHIPCVREELVAWLESVSGSEFRPYVPQEMGGQWHKLANSPSWSSRHLGRRGEWNAELKALPITAAFLKQAPLAECPPHAPECFISRLAPGTVLPPHYGLSNIKLTAHLALQLPSSGCSITVGGVTREWNLDDFLLFDDSFIHTAQNASELHRTVLIFDVWHPQLSSEERHALSESIAILDQVRTRFTAM